MSCNIQVVQYPEVLDISRVTQFYREVQHIVEAGVPIVLIDLKNVTLITSYGLMALIQAFRAVESAGGKFFICSMNEQARILFELTGLDQVFETFANLEEFNKTMVLTS